MTPAEAFTGVVHWVEYVGLLWFVGIVLVRRLAVMAQPGLGWARPGMERALTIALAGGLGVLIAGPGIPLLLGEGQGEGPSWIAAARVLAEGAALLLCVRGGRGAVPAGFAAVLLLSPAGHAVHVQPVVPSLFVDELHVVSAGMWAGGVLALATLRPPGGWRGAGGQHLLTRFGRVAMVAFAFTALTGLLRATQELTGLSDLWQTGYGLVLAGKSACVLAMLALAAVTWRRGVPMARTDAALAVAVMAATGFLAAFPTPPGGA